jgi:hypothetical protein
MESKSGPQPPDQLLTTWPIAQRLLTVPPALESASEAGFAGLVDAFDAHVAAEADTLEAYQRLAQTSDPVASLLIGIVLEDEQRHHALQQQIASRLRDALQWTHSPDALPIDGQVTRDPAVALAPLVSLIQHEQTSANKFRKLAEQTADLYGGLLSVLLETMAIDSTKHECILQFLLRTTLEQVERTDSAN